MRGPEHPNLAVIIVNYNTAELTLEAIESVLCKTEGDRRIDLHVVDNASPNGDADVLAAAVAATWQWNTGRYTRAPTGHRAR